MKTRLILFLQILAMILVAASPWLYGNACSHVGALPRSVGLVTIAAGILLATGAILALGHNLVAAPKPKETSPLITGWPFSWVRNPIYLALILVAFGWALRCGSRAAAVGSVFLSAILYVKILMEERFLREKFGRSYEEYCRKVGRFGPRLR